MATRDTVARYITPNQVAIVMLASGIAGIAAVNRSMTSKHIPDQGSIVYINEWAVIPWMLTTGALLVIMVWLAGHPKYTED